MSLLSRLLFLFVGVPLLELFVLIQMGRWVGLWPTIGLVVTTGIVGAALARLEGLRTVQRIQGELARGRLPGEAMMDGAAILFGGALLLTPGILTDLVGFSFLFPFTRKTLLARIRKGLEKRLETGAIRITTFGGGLGDPGHPWETEDSGAADVPDSSGEIVVEPRNAGEN